jgi:undecaprenyl-phosphate galactose phosphotransferase
MTGLAQISGSSKLKFEEEIKFDLYYVKNWSIYQDLKILTKTAILFFKPKPDC